MEGARIMREKRTVRAMVRLYCRGHHGGGGGPCAECGELLRYALGRLDACRYGERKTTCRTCPTHCYRRSMRERVRAVMRYAGPRMLLRHPALGVLHVVDEIRSKRAEGTP
jgi:hypothetical protein